MTPESTGGRQLALGKKVSLAGVAEGWGDECYAIMQPATYPEMLAVDAVDADKKDEQVKFQLAFVRKHFISGKVRVTGETDPVDMVVDDIEASVGITDRLFLGCITGDVNPKAPAPQVTPPTAA